MIISNQQVQSILRLQQMSQRKKTTSTESTESSSSLKSDTLELSSHVVEMQFAKDQVLKSPEVRADKVNELKKNIQEGNYQVTGFDIASKLVNRSLVDELAGR